MNYLRFPHEPEFEDIHSPSTLKMLIADIIGGIVELILLKEVGSTR